MSLNDFVVDALIRTERYKNTRLWTVENHAKYSTLTAPLASSGNPSRFNLQIFQLMCALNQQGMAEDGLCADAQGQGALKDILGTLTERLALLSENRHVHYVELGPEPIKTVHLLGRITEACTSLRYTAIDINQTSESVMRDAVFPIVEQHGSFNYIAADYRTVERADLHHEQDITLITLLGFQEGNELPVTTGRLIRSLASDATYIISEMQIYEEGLQSNIHAFYANPHMIRFSQVVALQQGYIPLDEHAVTLVRFKLLDELIHVAVTLQPVEKGRQQGCLLTNICLKYTPEQFRRIRARHCNCSVLDEFASGDGSVRYQIAKYLQ